MKKLADEKERALTERSNLQDKTEKDRRELEQAHSHNTRDMQERIAELEKSTKVCLNQPPHSSMFFFKGINKFEISK